MIDKERHERILTHLRKRRFVTVRELTSLLSSSEATIRRDLLHLENTGEIQRHWGGASLTASTQKRFHPPVLPESSLENRLGKLSEIKRLIAQKAVSLINAGETIIIDGGSSTYFMTEFLEDQELKIITNSFAIAAHLIDNSQNTIIIPGGIVYPESRIVLNPFDSSFFNDYTPSKLFMSVAGLSENGATNSDTTLIRLEKRMIASANELIVLCDSSKLMKRDSLFLCDLESIDTLITDRGISAPFRSTLAKAGVRVLVVEG
ncbi:MAG: DeoR/GlpR family DNA-binding transcription regulator [Propionivibrio sp.]